VRAIEINLATEPYRNDLPLASLLLALALVAFGMTGWGSYTYFTTASRKAELERELTGHSERMAAMRTEAEGLAGTLAKVDQETLASQATFVAGILEQRNFSWTRLFDVLERTVPWNVRLTSVRPVFRGGVVEVTLTGTAQDLDALLDFQTALLHSPHFENVVPGDYERDEADERIDFKVGATYLPPQPEAPAPGAGRAEDAGGPEPAEPARTGGAR
jgi:Tfp pilus assembly protein PilN